MIIIRLEASKDLTKVTEHLAALEYETSMSNVYMALPLRLSKENYDNKY